MHALPAQRAFDRFAEAAFATSDIVVKRLVPYRDRPHAHLATIYPTAGLLMPTGNWSAMT
jgi:hypothetical protein